MSIGLVILKSGDSLRAIESETDGTLELFYRQHIRSFKLLLKAHSKDKLSELLLAAEQFTIYPSSELPINQSALESIKVLRPNNVSPDSFWKILDAVSPRVIEWNSDELAQVAGALVGDRNSLAFDLKTQLLSGVFVQSPRVKPAAQLSPMVIDFDTAFLTVRSEKFGLGLTFKEVEDNAPFNLAKFAN